MVASLEPMGDRPQVQVKCSLAGADCAKRKRISPRVQSQATIAELVTQKEMYISDPGFIVPAGVKKLRQAQFKVCKQQAFVFQRVRDSRSQDKHHQFKTSG